MMLYTEEGVQFAHNLEKNNVTVSINQYNSTVHGFFGTEIGPGLIALEDSVQWIRELCLINT